MVRWAAALAVLMVFGVVSVRAENLWSIKVKILTRENNASEEVVIKILRQEDGKVMGTKTFDLGKVKSETEQSWEIEMTNTFNSLERNKYNLVITSVRPQSEWADNKGWDFSIRSISGFDCHDNEYELRYFDDNESILFGRQPSSPSTRGARNIITIDLATTNK